MRAVVRRLSGAIVIISIVGAIALNALYTTWSIKSEFGKGCNTLHLQATSTFYPHSLRHAFAELYKQRGC